MRTTACPECDEVIEVDPAMEGRRVACPECGVRFTVPGRRGQPTGRRRRPAPGPRWGLIGGLAAGAVALAAIAGVVVYKSTRPKPFAPVAVAPPDALGGAITPPANPSPSAPQGPAEMPPPAPPAPPVPSGWAAYTLPDVDLAAHLPSRPGAMEKSVSDMGVRVDGRRWDVELPGMAGGFNLDVMILPAGPALTADQEAVFLRLPRHSLEKLGGARLVTERAAAFGASKATEVEHVIPTGESVVTRYGFVRSGGRRLFVMAVAGGKGVSPADRAAFLDSIRPAK